MPVLPDEQYLLPEAVGQLFEATILSNDTLRILADDWCRLSQGNLLRAGALVRPLREAVNARRIRRAILRMAMLRLGWGCAMEMQMR